MVDSISSVTYSRECKLCGDQVVLDLGNSEEAQAASTLVFTSSKAFTIISNALDDLMKEHLLAIHQIDSQVD